MRKRYQLYWREDLGVRGKGIIHNGGKNGLRMKKVSIIYSYGRYVCTLCIYTLLSFELGLELELVYVTLVGKSNDDVMGKVPFSTPYTLLPSTT